MQRITQFVPAYDLRDENKGIGACRCLMVLKGEKGAVHFVFLTGMFLESAMEHLYEVSYPWVGASGKFYYPNKPIGCDVGYHSSAPMYDGENPQEDPCEWLDGQACYCDGSGLLAQEYMEILLEKGSDAIWDLLEDYYQDTFNSQ
ncbi:MAG: hypothetical protein DWQ49_08980 [Bacteroidetes bacterium]|mgnify:CR=1 FL=1|nr:MAG: hypothetical protein DWQ49_08980 [Bacteroidota bacterium]